MPETPSSASILPCVCASVRRISRLLSHAYDAELRPTELETTQYALLRTIEAMPHRPQQELGHFLGMDKTTLSRNLRLLEKNGWIALTPGPDLRQRLIALTPAGQSRLTAAHAHWHRAHSRLQSSMTPAQWQLVQEALSILTTASRSLTKGTQPL